MRNYDANAPRALELFQLFDLVDYTPSTGDFVWRAKRPRCRPGARAGCKDKNGYLRIRLGGTQYYASHIAWFYVFGAWPPGPLRHLDRDRNNNAISNLILADNPDNRPEKLGLAALPKFLRELEARKRAEQTRKKQDAELQARIRAFARNTGRKA